jgi:hypothetical protein
MILDDLLKLADAQESTISVASTSHIDTQAGGESYEGAFMYVRIDTAYSAGAGTPYASFSLQTAPDENFTAGGETLVSSSTYIASQLTAGTEIKIRIPVAPRSKRYIRGYQTVEQDGVNHYFSAGKFDMFITKDVDADRNLAI